MKFKSEDDAKNYSIKATTRHLPPDEARNRLESYRSYYKSADSDEDKEFWLKEVNGLEEYLESDKCKNGEYAQGIDNLILDLIEWRSAIFAFQQVDTKKQPFNEYFFFAQWLMGGTYAVFCILGKLVSKDERDSSLRRLWEAMSCYIKGSGLCGEGEVDKINESMHRATGYFTNGNSQAMLFRNKVIAHNESSPTIEWVEVDKDIKLLCRIWSLITMWSSLGVLQPFRKDEQAFSGLESFFCFEEMQCLQEQRRKYLEEVESWCTRSIVNGEKITDSSPFATMSIDIKPIKR